MNNFKFLNILNSQFVKPKNLSITELNGKYMLCLSAFLGYHRNLANAIFICINDKILKESTNDGLIELINSLHINIANVLIGNDKFKLGEDYYISESLYDYILNYIPDDNPDDDDSSYSSESSESSDSSHDDSSSSEEQPDDVPHYEFPDGIVIITGPDVNYTLSLTANNAKLLNEKYGKNIRDKIVSRKEILELVAPYFSPEMDIEDDFTEEEQEQIEQIIREFVLPDYIIYNSDFTFDQNFEYYEDLSEDKNKDFSNISNFYLDNISSEKTYSNEELENIPKSFFTIIVENALVQNFYTNINNQIYNIVMNYWKNGGSDCASVNIDLILGSLFAKSTTTVCGCNGISSTDTSTESCKDMYNNAMKEYLSKMLADKEFYYDWFYIPGTGECPDVNVPMINMLITLLQEFINEGRDLSFSSNKYHCQCPEVDTDNGACNYAIIENYIKVLNWVKNNNIEANANKINVYGSQFGTLLPKLIF